MSINFLYVGPFSDIEGEWSRVITKKIPSNPPPLPQQTQLTVGRPSPSLEKCSHDVYYKSTSIKVVPLFYSDRFSRTYICRLLEVLFQVWDKQCMYLYMLVFTMMYKSV